LLTYTDTKRRITIVKTLFFVQLLLLLPTKTLIFPSIDPRINKNQQRKTPLESMKTLVLPSFDSRISENAQLLFSNENRNPNPNPTSNRSSKKTKTLLLKNRFALKPKFWLWVGIKFPNRTLHLQREWFGESKSGCDWSSLNVSLALASYLQWLLIRCIVGGGNNKGFRLTIDFQFNKVSFSESHIWISSIGRCPFFSESYMYGPRG
jgi:hypothetical protein